MLISVLYPNNNISLLLQNQDVPKSHRNDAELEDRVKSLTENLIQKQTIIETLHTEKNSLVLQLERLEVVL